MLAFSRKDYMSKGEFITIRGVLNHAKVLGPAKPHTGLPKYDKGPNWSLDISPDAKSLQLMKAHGIDTKLKDPSPKDKNRFGSDKYLSLKMLLNRADGTKNDPPVVLDLQGKTWDNGNIGNGSVGDVKIKVVDYGRASDKGTYFQALRVLKHVPYEVEAFEPLSEDDEFFGAADEVTVEDHKGNVYDPDAPTPVFDTDLDDVPF